MFMIVPFRNPSDYSFVIIIYIIGRYLFMPTPDFPLCSNAAFLLRFVDLLGAFQLSYDFYKSDIIFLFILKY